MLPGYHSYCADQSDVCYHGYWTMVEIEYLLLYGSMNKLFF